MDGFPRPADTDLVFVFRFLVIEPELKFDLSGGGGLLGEKRFREFVVAPGLCGCDKGHHGRGDYASELRGPEPTTVDAVEFEMSPEPPPSADGQEYEE